MSNNFVKQGYDKAAEDYVSTRNQSENMAHLEKINSLLPPNSLVLDIGCGGGKPIDSYLISEGHRVIGIDISEKMIALAKQQVPEGDFRVEDMSALHDGEYRVDAVVSFYAIFHTPRETHKELLNKINSFTKIRGCFLSQWVQRNGKEKKLIFMAQICIGAILTQRKIEILWNKQDFQSS